MWTIPVMCCFFPQSLSLEWNCLGVGDSGIKLLSEGLAVSQSLKSLDLRSNHISHTGITFIASALDANTTLEELGEYCKVI